MESATAESQTAANEAGSISSETAIAMEDRCERTKETATTLVKDLALASGGGSPRNDNNTTTSPKSSPSEAHPSQSKNANEETIFSTIGMGIIPNFRRQAIENEETTSSDAAPGDNATDCALKAVQNAIERGILAFCQLHPRPQLSIRIGVPAKIAMPQEPMHVDQFQVLGQLNSLRNGGVELHQVETVIGGLWSPDDSLNCKGILTAVACLSLRSTSPTGGAKQPQSLQGVVSSSIGGSVPKDPQATTIRAFESMSPPTPMNAHQATAMTNTSIPSRTREFHRSSSMDVLAHVSAEIRDSQQSADERYATANAVAGTYGDKYGNNTNYKKLPPGKTPKNNLRLFVKHKYQDFSGEPASPDEQALLSDCTPNAAFPLKLHETLTEIEKDGHDDIIGWLSHGRSFKIHKQQDFVDQILPKYFV